MPQVLHPLDLTLVLPMRLGSVGGFDSTLGKVGWKRIDALERGAHEPEFGYVYAELSYFHPHVRRFLYGTSYSDARTANEASDSVRVYRHGERDQGKLLVQHDGWKTEFAVRDVLLHHVMPDAVLMSVHLSATEPLAWGHAMDAISLLRTITYQHYETQFMKTGDDDERLVWAGGDAKYLDQLALIPGTTREPVNDRSLELQTAIRARKPQPIAVWDDLLRPLRSEGVELSLMGDHRMAMMVFAGVPEPEQITEDQWFALSQADAAGYASYAPGFRDEELRKAVYDRWWDKDAGPEKFKHRYLAGPMTFLSVMRWPPEPRAAYFDRMRTTWHRQHFQIFLLAHYQRAALLILEQRIASLAADIEPGAGTEIESGLALRIEVLQGDIAKFSSGRWFPEVSPQIQGQELYGLLRRHLRLDELYTSVVEDKSLLGSWVEATEAKHRDRLKELIERKYAPAVLAVTALSGAILTEPLRNFFWWLLSHLWFWNALPKDGQSGIAGILVLVPLGLVAWGVWKVFRRKKVNGGRVD